MHIAFFSDQHPATLGGLQVSLGLQREYLERAGHTVTVCAPVARRVPSARYGRDDDVLLPAAPAGEYSFAVAGAAADRAADRGFGARPPVDVVHVQADFWGAWTGYRFARRHRLPVVHTMHTNVEVGLPAVMPFPRAVLRIMYAAHRHHLRCGPVHDVAGYVRTFAEAADAVVVPSSHFADRLAGYGVTRRPHVVPTGVDDDRVSALLAEPLAARGRPLVVWPGRVSREKRLGEFLEAFARSGTDADLAVYGGGSDLGHCRALAHRLGIGGRVRFAGSVSHDAVLAAMRQADLVAQSSLGYETQGLTVYEAVALGTPVLLRDPAIARDVPDAWCRVVADESVGALATAIGTAVAAPRPVGDPPGEFVQSRLTERLVAVYREVAAGHGGPRSDDGSGVHRAA
ncbi:glycosyltransferase [Pseudonocardia sp. EC080625-04]|uniref:glycosyltransferase n=1 Tax=Pseudonocardia sp. EC080625-04 TaxID=1096868 RepID=UPI000761F002|nr:glycosyltransferase [Pseudonocardia sp. EC080625-04]